MNVHKTISKDGTSIAYYRNGHGPAVILIDGAFCSKDFGPMPKIVELLAKNFTVISYDRRARGESKDTPPYKVEKEIEDIQALITEAGGSASLFGISSGAILAIKAVAYGLPVKRLALFEPPFMNRYTKKAPPSDAEMQLTQLIASGKNGDAVAYYLTKLMGLPALVPYIMRLTPNWKKMKANAPSLPYDAAICGDFQLPGEMLASIKIPSLVIDSLKSPVLLRTAAQEVTKVLPNVEQVSLKGKVHDVPAEVLVPVLEKFFRQ